MYLKTLTLRGFKSFASATTMRFEPGITCIVGPNGSGKSNVVDAFSWVMGEQGVKPLRGGKMEDVVFAGTAGRPALGRAEVTLTIDNSDGALPIDYSEVTISRLLFRSGQSEYAINGDQCRLLDIAELLSDTGLGREMHVIVGQGQLDEVLNAGPDARRALIEEAAGVLKHRRRKEKAVRKLDAMQANLTRLVDLTGELGRRLKPLGRQAEIARRAAVIQADLRDARLRLLADDYVTLAAELARDQTDEAAAAAGPRHARGGAGAGQGGRGRAGARRTAARAAAGGGPGRVLRAVGTGRADARRADLATERHRNLSAPEPQRAGRDPDELERRGCRAARAGARAGRAAGRCPAAADRPRSRAGPGRRTRWPRTSGGWRPMPRPRPSGPTGSPGCAARQRRRPAGRPRRRRKAGRLAEAQAQARARAEQAQVEYAALQDLVSGRGTRPGRSGGRARARGRDAGSSLRSRSRSAQSRARRE